MSCRKGKYRFKLRVLRPDEEATPGTVFTMDSEYAKGVILEVALSSEFGSEFGVTDVRKACENCWFYRQCKTMEYGRTKSIFPKCFGRSDDLHVWFREIGKL